MNLLSESLELLQKPLEDGNVKEDEMALVEHLIEHGDRGDTEALFSLAKLYLSQQQTEKALTYLRKGAELDDIQALYQLAVMYYDGLGTETCPEKGFHLMLKVAKSNVKGSHQVVPAAQFNVGRAYYQGFGVKQSNDEATKWWELCSHSDSVSSVRAMNTLALYYSLIDKEKAFSWHVKAAENGHSDSMGTLGLLYTKGEGCAVNKELSLKWLKKSAESGSIYGSGLLSHYYYTMKMYSKAVEIAKSVCDISGNVESLAAQSGSLPTLVSEGLAIAYFVYAQCLYLGQGIIRDVQKANTCFTKAKEINKTVTGDLHTRMMYGRL